METIKNYLDNLFASLPKTAKVLELKSNILANMEDKYNELKRQGKTENEAIGIVISEFGNIDELINELGIQKAAEGTEGPLVTRDEVEGYLNVKRVMGLQIGIGVILCILAPATLIFLSALVENGVIFTNIAGDGAYIPGLIALFLMITAAVGLFIYSGMNFERYKYMETGVQLPFELETELKQKYQSFNPSFYLCIIVGVCLIILSPIAIFCASLIGDAATSYGVSILLAIVAFSVFLFITSGTIRESYEKLLKIGDCAPRKNKKEDKVIGAVASAVWPLAAIVFLFCGFVYNLWYIAWIVFPIVGILFGAFSAVYSIITSKDNQ